MEDLDVEKAPFTIEESQNFLFNIDTRPVADSLNRSFQSDRDDAINDQLEISLTENPNDYKASPYRWVILFFFFNTTVFVSCC